MQWGYPATVTVIVSGLLLSAAPLGRRGAGGIVSWFLSDLVNESPSLWLWYLLVATAPALVDGGLLQSGVGVWFAVACASFTVTPVLLRRAARAQVVLQRSLDHGLADPTWRDRIKMAAPAWRERLPWVRIIAAPLPMLPTGVWRRRGMHYGPGRRHRLDVYGGHQGVHGTRPVVIHLHGGGFRSGRKSVYARPLLHAFARHGWICISASYRLRPATYSEMLTDVKRVVAWTRQHAADFGADPSRIVLGGSSAGAHLAITAALTAHHRRFQPGFEDVDTAVIAAFGLYGYYGSAQPTGPPSSPAAYANAAAPPIMIVHGAQDTLVPTESAEHLADTIRADTTTPVVYAELPGAQHTFDLLHSLRFELVIDALWSFCTWAARDRPRVTGRESSHPAGNTSPMSPRAGYEPHHPNPGQGGHIDD